MRSLLPTVGSIACFALFDCHTTPSQAFQPFAPNLSVHRRHQRTARDASADDSNDEADILQVGSTVIASGNIPGLNIWQFQAYELQSIYDQGTNSSTGLLEHIPRQRLDAADDNAAFALLPPPGYTRYVTLYSKKYHKESGPVIISPDEVGLSTVREEVVDSIVMALPLFGFWTALAYSFASQYSERTGGNFIDAMLGR